MNRIILIAIFLFVSAALGFSDVRKRDIVPAGWTKLFRANPTEQIQLTLALRQQNTDQLEKLFWEVSNPQSPKYAQYLSVDEITAMVEPTQETTEAVMAFLKIHGLKPFFTNRNKDMMKVMVPVATAEKMFENVEYNTYHHTGANVTVTRTVAPYAIPSFLNRHLDFVVGHQGFPVLHKGPRRMASKESAFAVAANPAILRERYNVTGNGGASGNKMAVAEFQGQYLSPTDLAAFCRRFVPQNPNCQVAKVVGSNSDSDPGVEAMLDIEYIIGVAPNIPAWFYSTPSLDFFSDLTSWITQILDDDEAPQVHSVSYGDQSEGPAGTYKDRLNTEFQKAGVRGLSIIFASGDSGTGCSFCYNFEPSFPATSPYVTSVGATRFLQDRVGPEAAVESFHSGGGFSNHFDMPSYQQAAVEHYLNGETDLPASHFYNAKGRATPDVAALGIGFQVLINGGIESVGGTSAAAPTFSGVIAMLNDLRLSSGKQPLGFLNQWLYQTAAADRSAFFDVTVGNNQHGCCGLTGFKCYEGWDPVTGLGTPNFEVLKNNMP